MPQQIADAAGIYRCTGRFHYRKFCTPGQPLPSHECEEDIPCTWELTRADNEIPLSALEERD